jgi:hypothetical protein
VRLEIREFGDAVKEVRYEKQWPPADVVWTPLALQCKENNIGGRETAVPPTTTAFDLTNGSAQFSYTFPETRKSSARCS